MLSALTIGGEGVNAIWYQLNKLINSVASMDGHFYGFFTKESELPSDAESGYAYISTAASGSYQIWNCLNGKWTDSGLLKTVGEYDTELSLTSTNAVQNKVVKSEIGKLFTKINDDSIRVSNLEAALDLPTDESWTAPSDHSYVAVSIPKGTVITKIIVDGVDAGNTSTQYAIGYHYGSGASNSISPNMLPYTFAYDAYEIYCVTSGDYANKTITIMSGAQKSLVSELQDVYKKSNYNDDNEVIDFNTIHLITDNPEFICVAIDTDDKILYGIKADGQPYFGVGCPQQVKDYVNEQINKILGTDDITTNIDSLKEIEAFLKDFTNGDTLKKLLDLKANVDEVRVTTDDIYKKSNPNDEEGNVVDTNTIVSIENNPEYIKVITDNVGKLIEAIGLDGIRKFFAGIEVQGTLQCVTDNPEYIAVWLDNQERIVFGFKINGDPYFGYGIPGQINSVIESLKSNIKTRIDTLQQSIDNNILALDYNSDTGELYSLTGEMSTINASMEDNGDVYLEQEII